MTLSLLRIDQSNINDHAFINERDSCFYLKQYFSGKDYTYGDGNNFISNFKKKVDLPANVLAHKKAAIIQAAAYIREAAILKLKLSEIVFVPIPPSKAANNPLYDDRNYQTLTLACENTEADVRRLIYAAHDMQAFHETQIRPSIAELKAALRIDEKELLNMKPHIMLFDDVLTNGTHYKACKELITERIPNAIVHGVFLARRVFPPDDEV